MVKFCVETMSYRLISFAPGPLAFASLPIYFAAYFRSALDVSRRLSLPEILKQADIL
jgi:hypothetical protein